MIHTGEKRLWFLTSRRFLIRRIIINLYKVYNGYVGNCAVYSLVTAIDESRAIELARPVYKRSDKREMYSSNLRAEIVFTDCGIEQCSEPDDGC